MAKKKTTSKKEYHDNFIQEQRITDTLEINYMPISRQLIHYFILSATFWSLKNKSEAERTKVLTDIYHFALLSDFFNYSKAV